jgi:hypothetical protein
MKCKKESASIDCIVFHAEIRNRGRQAVQWITYTCGGPGIGPEYKAATGDWKAMSLRPGENGDLSYGCDMNIMVAGPILPGEAAEFDFTLFGLLPPFDTAPLHSPGEHKLRFVLDPNFCFASPDGGICLKTPKEKPPIFSREITISSR